MTYTFGTFLDGSAVRNLPAVKETWICSLGNEDPLEEEMASHSSILAWKISWTVAQMVKNLPAMQETWIQSLGPEDPMEKGVATHSTILSGEFHGLRSLASHSLKSGKSQMWQHTHTAHSSPKLNTV